MRKTYSLIAVFILSVLILTGCGGAALESLPVIEAVNGETAVTTADNTVTDNTTANVVPAAAPMAAPAQEPLQTDGIITLDLQETQDTLINLYERINPAVVNIQVKVSADAASNQFEDFQLPEGVDPEDLPENHPFFGPQYGQGSGFVYDEQGHIITNNHVVGSAERITVIFSDGTQVEATLVGVDPDSDLAVIKVNPDEVDLTTVPLGDSDEIKVGQYVIAIGNPFGLSGSMTSGIISGLGRNLPADATAPNGRSFSIPDIIQTDAAINPGNSGGPLLNLDGEVVGVNTAIATNNGAFSGVGYAVPVETVQKVAPQIIENGEVQNAWIGISGQVLSRDVALAMNLDANQRGILVVEIVGDGPAAKSDLRGSNGETTIDGFSVPIGGDVIIAIDDVEVREFDNLLSYIVQEAEVGQTVTLTVLRGGEEVQLEVTLEARPKQ
jgi:S1-C subfamily serine protease